MRGNMSRHREQTGSSGLALAAHIEGSDGAALLCLGHLDGSEGALIAHDILLKSGQEALGMLGSQDDAAAHLGLGQAGEHASKIYDELARRMGDDSEIGIFALRLVGCQLNLQSLLLLFVFVHCFLLS